MHWLHDPTFQRNLLPPFSGHWFVSSWCWSDMDEWNGLVIWDGLMELGPSQLWKAVCGKSTVPGQQELRLPRTALSSGLISQRCERNVGSGSSDVLLKCGNIYLPHKVDRQKQTIKFVNNLHNNLKHNNRYCQPNFVIFWLHLTKLLVQFPGWGFGFIAPYQFSCTVVAIVGLVGEEVDVSTVHIQHIIKMTFNSTPVCFCCFGVWGGNPRKLWFIIHPVRVTCKYCNFHSWFWNTTHWQCTHYLGFQSSAVWCCVIGCVVPDISKVCSAFILNGRAIHEERLLEDEGTMFLWNTRTIYPPFPAGLESLRNKTAL